ncbi:MAG TPA: DNA polymerase III subunit epsilon [Afifellaceae bacterium]|nr:DNA polymerase III subunit epsilon [Afifellaceae bacterium]
MREIVFDTETTGLDPLGGDRLIEIGCVELFNRIPTGRTFHAYCNPGRPVSRDAIAVHGLDDTFLRDKPAFEAICAEFLDFIGDCPLVAHNAAFDRGFINMEVGRVGHPELPEERFVDTLFLARRRHPGGANNLDALCVRYQIDNSRRTRHGALLDAEILAEVYIELLGGRQAMLALGADVEAGTINVGAWPTLPPRPRPLAARISDAERLAHRQFVDDLGEAALWLKLLPTDGAQGASA